MSKVEITHLVTAGCSYTYCEGLESPSIQGWPKLVAEKLGVPIVNIALPGISNQAITRLIYEYVFENLPYSSKPFFIVAWTQPWRKEAWYNNIEPVPEYDIIPRPLSIDNLLDYQKEILLHDNDEDNCRRTLLNKAQIKSLFRSFNIPYIMSNYSGEMDSLEFSKFRNMFYEMDTWVHDLNHIRPFYDITNTYPKTKCQHDGPEAQIVLSNYIIKEINKLYDWKNVPNRRYLKLSEFNIQKNKRFNDWL